MRRFHATAFVSCFSVCLHMAITNRFFLHPTRSSSLSRINRSHFSHMRSLIRRHEDARDRLDVEFAAVLDVVVVAAVVHSRSDFWSSSWLNRTFSFLIQHHLRSNPCSSFLSTASTVTKTSRESPRSTLLSPRAWAYSRRDLSLDLCPARGCLRSTCVQCAAGSRETERVTATASGVSSPRNFAKLTRDLQLKHAFPMTAVAPEQSL